MEVPAPLARAPCDDFDAAAVERRLVVRSTPLTAEEKGVWRDIVKAMPRDQGEAEFERWKLEHAGEVASMAPENVRIEILRGEGGKDWIRIRVRRSAR